MTEQPPLRPTDDLSKRTLAGLQWNALGSAVSAVLHIVMAAILARLLSPAAFGLVALASVFLRFADYFSRAGITQALIQKHSLSRDDIRAGFTLSVAFGTAFGVSTILLAPLAGRFAEDPELVPVLQLLSLGLLLNGLGAPSVALLRRHLRFKELAMLNLGSYVAGYAIVGISMALAGAGVYALVAASLTQTAVKAIAAYALIRHPLMPTLSRASHRAILGFGSRITGISILEFLRSNLDTLAVGRWAGSTQLGFYNRANMLADLPAYHLSNSLSQVLFPSFSAIQSELRRLRNAYLSAVGATAAIIFPLNAGMAVSARELILVILGPQWVGAIEVMPWLLLASAIGLTGHFAGIVAEAQAALNAKMLIAGGSTATLALLLWLAEGRSLSAYGAALAGAAAVSHIGYVLVISRTLDTSFGTLVRPLVPAIAGAGLVAAAIAGTRVALIHGLGVSTVFVLVAEIIVGALTLAALFRKGPLRVYRYDFARRLTDAGALDGSHRKFGRLVAWLVGPTQAKP